MSEKIRVENVSFIGTTEEIAVKWAEVNGGIVREEMGIFEKECADRKIPHDELMRRNEKFISIADEIAPHWLKEAEIIAEKVGIDPDIYKTYIGGRYRGNVFSRDECTSYTALRQATKDGSTYFHKNRDNWDKKQCAFLMKSTDLGLNKFFGIADAQVIGCMMMVNDKGVAVSADTGGTLAVKRPAFEGLMNVAILRYLGEKASSADEAVEIIKEMVGKRYYAGGASTGTHWLAVDASSTGIEISCNSDEVDVRPVKNGIYFSARGDVAYSKRLKENFGKIDFPMFNAGSRDESVCFKSSVSGMSVEISYDDPANLTTAWTALPAKSIPLPVFMGADEVPRPLADGTIYTLGKKVDAANLPEEKRFERTLKLYEEMKQVRKTGDAAQMAEWTRKAAAGNIEMLENI